MDNTVYQIECEESSYYAGGFDKDYHVLKEIYATEETARRHMVNLPRRTVSGSTLSYKIISRQVITE